MGKIAENKKVENWVLQCKTLMTTVSREPSESSQRALQEFKLVKNG